ncbi:alpha/beta fold hydrolase [Spirosoma validum]|uniref:Alpha/beta hydrolase n=1 Tax=Spirosoma validum TaxID=2771355 RepID=A0A927GC72_9BACT|nr:alpha/beta hydrolase [Spirosoma validum]MBD2752156.1 alpha/beta hydrolase [Spirosoma validum]
MKYTANGIELNVLERGRGDIALVFLHYFGGSSLEWQAVIDHLSDQYRCLAIDLRGCGDSEAPETGYSVDDMADDVAALLRELHIQQFVLIGHSMSGKVALALAAGTLNHGQPDGLNSLILVSPSPPVPEPIPDDERQKLLQGHGQRSSAEQTLKNITAAHVSKRIQEQIIQDDLRTSKQAWDAWLLAGSKENISDRMTSVVVPVHILAGTEDHALPPDVQTRLVLPYLKNATFDTVEGIGHLIPWEAPDTLVDFIQKKITGNSPK